MTSCIDYKAGPGTRETRGSLEKVVSISYDPPKLESNMAKLSA